MIASARGSRKARNAKGSAALKLRFRPSVRRIRDYEAPEEGREGKLRLERLGMDMATRWLEMFPPLVGIPLTKYQEKHRDPEIALASPLGML